MFQFFHSETLINPLVSTEHIIPYTCLSEGERGERKRRSGEEGCTWEKTSSLHGVWHNEIWSLFPLGAFPDLRRMAI